MIKPIITDRKELAKVSIPACDSILNANTIMNLEDTAEHHRNTKIGCAGLAANQIGYLVRIIVIWDGATWIPMINPVVEPRTVRKAPGYEGCLSRPGVNRKIQRYKRIKATFLDQHGNECTVKYNGWLARVVQHEVDHLDGVFI